MDNIILKTDSYKTTHWPQYPIDTQRVYSYFESRDGATFDHTVFFGLQYILQKHLTGIRITEEMIDEAEHIIGAHIGPGMFNIDGWKHILHKHGGRIPVEIKAVPEGSRIPTSNVLMTVENTDEECPWITNYIETILTHVWYPCTVASQGYEMRRVLQSYLNTTGSDPVDFKLHDFGYRGVTCDEQAAIGGAAHLINFTGTDNLAGVMLLKRHYSATMPGLSIPASEHSTITSWGRDHELDAFRNMLDRYPTGLVACVSDSFNIWEACDNLWGTELRDQILHRDGVLIVRPDSGSPGVVIPKLLAILGKRFGHTVNDKGYKVLNPHVRVIQGDGIDKESLPHILSLVEQTGWSADNLAFGSGGGLLQKMNRDTQRFAFKCSAIKRRGIWQDVYKDPITDSGKTSKRGRLALWRGDGIYQTVTGELNYHDELQTVFKDGVLVRKQTLEQVRRNLHGSS